MKRALIASKGSSQWGFRGASAAFPARAPFRLASIPQRCAGKGWGSSGRAGGSFPFLSHTASVVRAGPAEGSRGWRRTKPHSSLGTASFPAARGRRWAGLGTPSCSPGRAARPGAHRAPIQDAGSGPGDPGRFLSELHNEERLKPAFISGLGTHRH